MKRIAFSTSRGWFWCAMTVVLATASGCAESIVSSKKPIQQLACSDGDEVIPVAHRGEEYEWRCGKPPVQCDRDEKVGFQPARDGGVRWGCLHAIRQKAPRRDRTKLKAELRAQFLVVALSRPVRCRTSWRDTGNVQWEEADWEACGSEPIAGKEVVAAIGESRLRETTSAQGIATFDLSAVSPTASLLTNPTVVVVAPAASNGEVGASASVTLEASEILQEWTRGVRATADAKDLETIETGVVGIERILANLENAKEPWGDAQLEESMRIGRLFQGVKQGFLALAKRKPVEVAVSQRLAPLVPRIEKFPARLEAILPKAKRAAEAKDQRTAALLAALFSPIATNGSETSDAEERRQRERAEEDKRAAWRIQEEETRRNAAKRRCQDACWSANESRRNPCDFGSEDRNSCLARARADKETCLAGCER